MADTRNAPDRHPITEELAGAKDVAAATTALPGGRLPTPRGTIAGAGWPS